MISAIDPGNQTRLPVDVKIHKVTNYCKACDFVPFKGKPFKSVIIFLLFLMELLISFSEMH